MGIYGNGTGMDGRLGIPCIEWSFYLDRTLLVVATYGDGQVFAARAGLLVAIYLARSFYVYVFNDTNYDDGVEVAVTFPS